MTTAKKITVTLADLAYAEIQCSSPDLDVSDYATIDPIIVERTESRKSGLEIVDGYHRACGLVGWARSEGLDLSTVSIVVVDATGCTADDGTDLVAAAATPDGFDGWSQEDAIAAITETLS